MKPAKPRQLRQGEAIGVIAPAGPVLQKELKAGLQLLEAFGYEVVPAPHLYDKKGYMAGDDETRLEDFHAMFANNRVKAIFCARGGYGTLRILDRIDYRILRDHPKIIVGYSDITALLWAIYKKTGLVSIHGPVLKELAKRSIGNLESFLNLVSSDGALELELAGGRSLIPGQATGTLLGGNLSLICNLVGSPFMPSLKGAILFMEEKGEDLYRIDRMLTYLKLCGVLSKLRGLIAGSFEDCGDRASIERLLLDRVSGLDIPLVTGLPIGHGLINVSLPIGVQAIIDTEKMTLKMLEPCVIP